jgi:ubiquinone/menaquinone biosynthesis C-methylase UbiE
MNREKSSQVPFQKQEVQEYEKKRYRGLDQIIVHKREQKILKKMLKIAEVKNRIVLDIPCGYGRFSGLLYERDFSIVNSDLSLSMVERAVETSLKFGGFPSWGIAANAKEGLPFKDHTFGLILCIRFFHHIHDKNERIEVLKEFSRASSRWVIVSYYQMNSLHRIQRKIRKAFKKSRTRISMVTRQDFKDDVREGGLSFVKVFPLLRGIHAQHIALLKIPKT